MSFLNDPGMIVVIVAMAIFYLRLMQLRGKKRRLEREAMVHRMREANRKKGKLPPAPAKDPNAPPFGVTSWILVGVAIFFMLAGVVLRTTNFPPQLIHDLWWAPTTVGVIVMVFCMKVEVAKT